jgi:predicted RND superfamily exporter protein
MHERLRRSILSWWGRSAAGHPLIALGSALLVAALAGGFAMWTLDFRTDRSELVSMKRDWNRRYAEYKRNFPRWDDITIAIEGAPADDAIDELARRIAERLREDPRIAAADAGFDAVDAPRMYQLGPDAEFRPTIGEMARLRGMESASNVNSAYATLLLGVQQEEKVEAQHLRGMLESAVVAVRGGQAEFLQLAGAAWRPFLSSSGRIRIISAQVADVVRDAGGLQEALDWMRETIAREVAAAGVGAVEWGITGIPAIEGEETAQSTLDSMKASILAFVLLAALLVAVFRGVVVPLFASASLLIALAWAFGWAALAVGHLQILSVFFTVMFLGIGMDFAVHLAARYELVRDHEDNLVTASGHVFEGVGPSILTGALTTAASFSTIALTDFRGAAELGLICAGGILLCVICVPTVFPGMLALTRRWRSVIHSRPERSTERFKSVVGHFTRRPSWTIVGAISISTACIALGSTVRYDPDILNLQAPGSEAVEWERRLVEEDRSTAWAGLLVIPSHEAPRIVPRLRAINSVEDVSAMGKTVLDDENEWTQRMESVEQARVNAVASPPFAEGAPALRDLLTLVSGGIRQRAPEHMALAEWIDEAVEQSQSIQPEHLDDAWTHLNESFLERRAELGRFLEVALGTDAVSASNIDEFLPPELQARWIGRDGSWLLRIQPRPAEESVLHPDRLGDFVKAVRGVAPEVIGPPVQIYESGRLIQRAYITAALLALPLVVLLLLLDFQSIIDAVCVLIPVSFGFIAMFGIMGAFGEPLNFANMIVLPITFGIAIDAGVHMVHRWRSDPQGEPPGLSGGTGRGITITVLTTLIGFACLLVAEHRGIRSLGFVVVAGQASMLVACYTILPAVLALRRKRHSSVESQP